MEDNAPAHTSQVAMTAATECEFEVLPHPPYSPDMAPSDFYLSVPKFELQHSWNTVWKQRRRHIAAVNGYLEDQQKNFYLEGISKLEVHCLEGKLY